MQKNKNLLLCAVLCITAAALPQQSPAQIRLQHIEDFDPGHKMIYVPVKDSLAPGPGGANKIWDFAHIKTGKDSVHIDILPVPEEYQKQFPKANSIERRSDSPVIIVDKQKDRSQLWGAVYQKTVYDYDQPYTFIKRPFTYMDSVMATPARSYESYGKTKGSGTSKTIADGWGKLLLPDGEHKVLRIRFEQEYTDIGANGSAMKMTIVTYGWFEEEHKGALLKINDIKIKSPFYNNTIHSADYMVYENQ